MTKPIGLASAILVSLFCFAAAASDPVPMVHQGIPGQWFPRPMVDQIQSDLLALDASRVREVEFNIKLDLRMKRIEDLKLAVEKTSKALDVAERGLTVAENAAREQATRAVAAEESERSVRAQVGKWYRHPATWFGAGVLITVVVELVVYGLVK